MPHLDDQLVLLGVASGNYQVVLRGDGPVEALPDPPDPGKALRRTLKAREVKKAVETRGQGNPKPAAHLDDQLVLLRVASGDDQVVLRGDEPVEALEPVHLAGDQRGGARGGARLRYGEGTLFQVRRGPQKGKKQA